MNQKKTITMKIHQYKARYAKLLFLALFFLLHINIFSGFAGNTYSSLRATAPAWAGSSMLMSSPKPTNLSGVAVSSTQINLSFTNNVATDIRYCIEMKTSTTEYDIVEWLMYNVTTYQCKDLLANTDYTFRVRGYDEEGYTEYTEELTIRTLSESTPPVLPSAPTNLSASAVSSTQIHLSWTDNASNESGFRIERKNGTGSFAEIATVSANSSSYDNTGLNAGTGYTYRVRAYNASGNSSYTSEISASTSASASNKPTNLSGIAVSTSQIDLSFTNNAGPDFRYCIEMKTSTTEYDIVDWLNYNVTTYQCKNLLANTDYTFRVRGYYDDYTEYSDELTLRTLSGTVTPPSGLTVTLNSANQVILNWTDNSSNETGFKIERKTGTGSFTEIATVSANTSSYSDRTTASSTSYSYRVAAINASSSSAYTPEAPITTPAYITRGIERQYNGNIAAVRWQTATGTDEPQANDQKEYDYYYDAMNRISASQYINTTTPGYNGTYDEGNYTYDFNGNLLSLKRKGKINLQVTGVIDDLTYSYDGIGNQLMNVSDAEEKTVGFIDKTNTRDYEYDANGNMVADRNKGITIQYNLLNLPQEITSGTDRVVYTYTATGVKLSKKVYKAGALNTTIDYNGELEFYDGKLKFIHTDEGLARYDETTQTFGYEYYLKDHLGNTRAVVTATTTGQVQVLQASNYYAFGMSHTPTSPNNDNKYLYNGKEKQDDVLGGTALDWYDYGKRFYNPQTAHWPCPDPRAEKYYNWSPYCYAADNPIFFIDPQGDTLNVNSASASATTAFNQINSQGTGGYYTTTVDKNGNVTLTATGKKGTMTKEQKAYYNTLNTVINSETKTSINVVENDNNVTVGDASTKTIDVGDMKAIDQNNKVVTAPSMLGHEIWEQFNLTYGVPLGQAHVSGSNKEGDIGNYTRNPITGGIIQPDPTRPGAGNELLIIKVDRSGKRSAYIIDLTNRNVTKVVKSENP